MALPKEKPITRSFTTQERYQESVTPELILGVSSPIGTNKRNVIKILEEFLQSKEFFGYDDVHIIKISSIIQKLSESKGFQQDYTDKSKGYKELKIKIDAGNHFRDEYTPQVFAELAIKKILVDWAATTEKENPELKDFKPRRVCYIIDSIKNKQELQLFRSIFGNLFYLISIFSVEGDRKNTLKKIVTDSEADELIEQDEYEKNSHGQNVRETFIQGDFFINIFKKDDEALRSDVLRYLDLIFETAIITPNLHEIAMYKAKSAASNSACLSRQVGASITDRDLNLISVGWNDVPKYGGNLYTSQDGPKSDFRCFNKGYCSNDTEKDNLVDDIIKILDKSDDIRIDTLDQGRIKERLTNLLRNNTKLKDLIEFSRSVHAEMHAIISGSQLSGSKMIDGKLFCTTYPCHNCTRHIIAAGIKEVFFIEPYKKSRGIDLHGDSISEDVGDKGEKVIISMFNGVSPRRFLKLFSNSGERKEGGYVSVVERNKAFPKDSESIHALYTLEEEAIVSLTGRGFGEEELLDLIS